MTTRQNGHIKCMDVPGEITLASKSDFSSISIPFSLRRLVSADASLGPLKYGLNTRQKYGTDLIDVSGGFTQNWQWIHTNEINPKRPNKQTLNTNLLQDDHVTYWNMQRLSLEVGHAGSFHWIYCIRDKRLPRCTVQWFCSRIEYYLLIQGGSAFAHYCCWVLPSWSAMDENPKRLKHENCDSKLIMWHVHTFNWKFDGI